MSGPSTTRRGMLAIAVTAMGAGCLDFGSLNEAEPIDSYRFQEVVQGDREPVVVDDRPVEIEADHLETAVDRVADLLGELPLPLGPEEIPNGYIRRELTDAAAHATDGLDEARSAPNRLAALDELRHARGEARYAAAGWAFVDDGLTADDLRTAHREITEEARSVAEDIEYRGTDPVDAALVYGLVEDSLDRVVDDRPSPGRRETSQLLTVAEWGDRVETARTSVEDARYLAERFQASLDDDAESVEPTLSAAVDDLAGELADRRSGLPPEPSDEDDERVGLLRDRLRRAAEAGVGRVDDAPGPASGLLSATEAFVAFGAHERLLYRLEDGNPLEVETASDVLDARNAAVDAIETAHQESPRAELVRPILADAAESVSFTDERLGEFDGEVQPRRFDGVVERYVSATLRARSVPDACERTVDALDR
ncbi:MAG: hypothetical protein ACOC0Z_08145 [Halohasta sp.]